ncbi:uncharacterized protein LOC117100871 [Anneissia japonica]|uniref:uncharacterized protein LOC117100871 n=1 Tax=Anneissia japonica TaxID=1529436 RepID=UPI001425AF31|nr:uncharacterized protein LOC117100871 [Anneissia japonica]
MLKNQNGLTAIDVYVQNMCEEYENTKKEKEEILQILHSFAVPGVILARGKQALSVFNKDLEKGQIRVYQAQLIGVGGIFKKTVRDILSKMLHEEEIRTDGMVHFAIDDYSDSKVKKDIDEPDGVKQKSKSVAKQSKEVQLQTSNRTSTTVKTRVSLTKELEPIKTEGSSVYRIFKKLRDRNIYTHSKVEKKVNGFETEALENVPVFERISTTDLPSAVHSSRGVFPHSRKRKFSSKPSSSVTLESEDTEVLKLLEKEHNTGCYY